MLPIDALGLHADHFAHTAMFGQLQADVVASGVRRGANQDFGERQTFFYLKKSNLIRNNAQYVQRNVIVPTFS